MKNKADSPSPESQIQQQPVQGLKDGPEPLATVGVCPRCKRIVFASVNEDRKELAREVAKLVRAGILIQTMECEQVRTANWVCECPKGEKKNV